MGEAARPEGSGRDSGRVTLGGFAYSTRHRHLLLPALWALQEHVGWLSHAALDYLCTRLGVAPAEAYGVASAYALLSLEEAPPTVVHVCDDIACRAASLGDPGALVQELLGPEGFDRGSVTWARSPCLGRCEHGSAAMMQVSGDSPARHTIAPARPDDIRSMASGPAAYGAKAKLPPRPLVPQIEFDRSGLRLLGRIGLVDPRSLDSYRSHGGYQALRRAIEIGPDGVIGELREAKLLGRGGAAFPIADKWQAVATNPTHPHYFVCNADESEPGTFKDRVLIENDPFALVEAITIAGFVTGAERAYVYIRGEYPEAETCLRHAIESARKRGYLGEDVAGAGFRFDIEMRRGAGAYIAGEETALFNSIEGRRPEPRNKPPYPTQSGLFGRPTGVNNVETLVNVLEVLRIGGRAYSRIGTRQSTGTRLFCLSGNVARPGLYEAEMGLTLSQLLELAGGVTGGELAAVLLGGAAGFFAGPDQLDVELSFEGARAAGLTLGSGVVMVFNDKADFGEIVRRIARFFRDESCGQCVPCRVGTVRQEELVTRMAAGMPLGSRTHELELLGDLAAVMKDASICGLGQTATGAVESAIRLSLFPVQGGRGSGHFEVTT